MPRIRASVELDEARLEMIMDRYGVKTKTAAVDLALRYLAGQPLNRDEALAMRGAGATGDVSVDTQPSTAE